MDKTHFAQPDWTVTWYIYINEQLMRDTNAYSFLID